MQHWLQFWFGALPDSFRARFFSQTFRAALICHKLKAADSAGIPGFGFAN
jgi:hypothetical protein